jgi:tRNA(Ile2) C34 agmatinyltransferase TiaS
MIFLGYDLELEDSDIVRIKNNEIIVKRLCEYCGKRFRIFCQFDFLCVKCREEQERENMIIKEIFKKEKEIQKNYDDAENVF